MTQARFPLAHPALLFVVLAWGLNFSVIKLGYGAFEQALPPTSSAPACLALVRCLAMLPLLGVWCRLAGQSLRYQPGEFLKLNFAGFIGSGVYIVLFMEGMRTAPAAHAAIALATAPMIATALSALKGQDRMSWRLAVGSLVAFGGVALSVGGPGAGPQNGVVGVLLVVASAAFWAWSIVLYRDLLQTRSPVRVLALSFPGALVALLPYGCVSLATLRWRAVPATGWWCLGYLVVVAGVGAFAAYYRGLADVGPARASMTQYFIPPVAALFAALVLQEPVTWREVVGLLVVVSGVALAAWRPLSAEQACTAPPRQESPQSTSA